MVNLIIKMKSFGLSFVFERFGNKVKYVKGVTTQFLSISSKTKANVLIGTFRWIQHISKVTLLFGYSSSTSITAHKIPPASHQIVEYFPTVRLSVSTADVYIAKKLATVEDFAESLLGLILYRTPWPIKGVLRIQQYLQHEHYALWEVIEFGDSYKAPLEETAKDKGQAGEVSSSTKKKGRTVAITAKDMQKRKNDVKARTTLLLGLPNEHQLRFIKYDSAKELWEAILKTFGGNEATKKTKKNQLKLQYGNFKAEVSETLKQTFNRLQAIESHLKFMDVPIEQDDLNQKFLTSIAPEWLVYTIVWRNRDDLDTMSLDDVYNHLKVYKPEVQKRAGSNSQNMAFISSSNTSSGKSEVPTVQGASTATTQPNGSQIKYKDISQIDDDDIEEIDIKWSLALLSMRADMFWKKTGKKITIQGSDVADHQGVKTKVRESYKKDPKVEESAPKEMVAIDGLDGIGVIWLGKMKLQRTMLLWPMKKKPTPSIDVSKHVSKEQEERRKSNHPSFFKQGGSSDNVVPKPMIKFVKETGFPNATKVNNTECTRKPTVKYVEIPKIPIVGSKIPTTKPAVAADKGNKGKAFKALARWIWKPKQTSSGQDFKLVDDKHVLLRTPRQQNMYTVELKNIVPHKNLTCLIAKASVDESMLWHRRVLVIKPQNKTPYELFNKRSPVIGFLRPFGCHVMILNTLDHLGKFDAKGDEGYFLRYSLSSKAFRVFIKRTKKIEENLHVDFLKNKSIKKGTGPDWLFDIDTLTNSMNYVPVVVVGTSSTNILVETEVPTVSSPIPLDSLYVPLVTSSAPRIISKGGSSFLEPLSLGNAMSFENRLEDFFGDTSNVVSLNEVEADLSNLETAIQDSPTPTLRIHKDHPENPEFPHRVYKVEKAMYGLRQAPRAWYGTLSKYLLENGFQREYAASASGCGQVLWIQNQLVDYRVVTQKTLQIGKNGDPVVNICLNFLHGSDNEQKTHEFMHIYLASASVCVDRFWSTARVETRDGETKILAQVNGRQRTVSESLIRRHLKLNNEEDETAFPTGDVRYREAFPTDTRLDVGQDRENIAKTSAMPHEALPRVTSLGGGEGRLRLLRIMRREEKDLLKRMLQTRGVDQGEDLLDTDKSADKGSDNTDKMSHILGSLEATNILASTDISPVVTTASGSFPTAAIVTTTSVATPNTRVTRSSREVVIGSSSLISVNISSISKKDKGKGKITEPKQPSKEKVLEQLSVQLARYLEAKFAQEDQIFREQVETYSKIVRIHDVRELEMMIADLDRSNEMIAKYLSEYEKCNTPKLGRSGISGPGRVTS
nr:ribonuclease H-like domain-containing protein [Tanacetum cinerariifolium]